jgi:lipopolysaccharide transport system ATP-binding protein
MISVRVDGLGKAYRVYKRPIDSLKELIFRRDYAETIWALRDVSFEVEKGGALGIVGDNGAGKSTLLKLLAGALTPTTGGVERSGRAAALLSLGGGFHPDLTGTENARIGCAVLGLSPADTEAELPRIAEFSELGEFMERPVRTYSSGMYLRLAFSVATVVDPDVLVIDEHLSVGDQHFQHKCQRRIMALREAGCTLVLSSHDVRSIGEVCDRVLWLRQGRPVMLAAAEGVLNAYQDHVRDRDAAGQAAAAPATPPPSTRREDAGENRIHSVTLEGGRDNREFLTGDPLRLRLVFRLSDQAARDGVHAGILIVRNDAVWCYGNLTKTDQPSGSLHAMGGGQWGLAFVIDQLPLLSGQYTFTVALLDDRSPHVYDYQNGVVPFSVRNPGRDVGAVRIPHRLERP